MMACVWRAYAETCLRHVRLCTGGMIAVALIVGSPMPRAGAQETQAPEDAEAVADAMRAIGRNASNEDLVFLVRESPNKYIRGIAARWLGERNAVAARPVLLAAMNDPKRYVQSQAAVAYGRIGACALESELLALFQAPRTPTRFVAIGAALEIIKRCPSTRIADKPALLAGIQRLLRDPSADVRRDGLVLVRRLPPIVTDAERTSLFLQCLDDPDAKVRLEATRALQGNTEERVVVALVARLEDSERPVVKAAIRGLGGAQNPRAKEAVRRMLHHRNPDFRLVAIQATADMDDASEASQLAGLLEDRVAENREAVVIAIGSLHPPDAARLLLPALEDQSPAVRQRAASTLQSLCPKEDADVARALARTATDSNPGVARAAARALRCLGNKEIVPELINALCRCPHSSVRGMLSRVLTSATGGYPGNTCRAWRQWWTMYRMRQETSPTPQVAEHAAEGEEKSPAPPPTGEEAW